MFVVTMLLFVVFNVCCAVSPNIWTLLIFRCLSGFFGSTAITNGGGCLVDMWPQSHRSVPFALFTTGGSFGPILAPIVGGFISQVSTSSNLNRTTTHNYIASIMEMVRVLNLTAP